MVDLVVSFVAVLLLATVVLLAVAAVTVLPMVLTLERAEQRGLDPDLWGGISIGLSLLALGGMLALRDSAAVVGPLVLSWAGFALVHRFGAEGARVPGAHR